MELDQLKQRWQQTGSTGNTPPKNKFKMILRRRNEDPISSMKRNFRRQIIVLLLVFFLFLHELRNREVFHNAFFDWYLVCGTCLCVFFFLNLRLVRQLEKTDESLTDHIRAHVALLGKGMRWRRIFSQVAIASLIILLEILPFFSSESMLQKWHAVAPIIRIAAYAGLLLFQYYAGRLIAHRRYGQHLDRL